MNHAILYQKTATGRLMSWEVFQEDNVLIYKWGYVGGVIQEQREEVSGIKQGTAAEKTPEEQATLILLRKVEERKLNGYKDSINEAYNSNPISDFKLYPLPTSFSPPKPISSKPCLDKEDPIKKKLPNKVIQDLIDQKRLWAQRKANGVRCYYVVAENPEFEIEEESDSLFPEEKISEEIITKTLYSRKIKDVSQHFKPLKDLLDLLPVPPNSIIDMEVTLGGGYTDEQFRVVSSMTPITKPYEAMSIYRNWLIRHPNDPLIAYSFDVIYWDGVCVLNQEYEKRYNIAMDLELNYMRCNFEEIQEKFSIPDNMLFKDAIPEMESERWEGCVLWDKKMKSEFWLNGKPKRLKGCWKWKNTKVADCVIADVIPEKGDENLVGSLYLHQFDSENGKIIQCGQAGSGLSDEDKSNAWGWIGKVVKIEYDERMPLNINGERCFRNPRILGLHEDKTSRECLFEEEE